MRYLGRLFVLVFLTGCSKESVPAVAEPAAPPVVVERRPAPVSLVPTLKPFREVAISEVPDGENRPPDLTVTGLSVGKLFEQVAVQFDQIKFVDARGRKLVYRALLKTDDGDIRIELLGDSAPNHVRNFIALARVGYYSGLPFHRNASRIVDEKAETHLEAGCPLGTGDLGYGSLGYWLKAEPSDEYVHEAGMVGASHSLIARGDQVEDLDNAACKFYIALTKAPWRDRTFTIFGKVIQGLDAAHTISKRPNQAERGSEDRPLRPAIIREVVIEEVVANGSQIAAR